MHPSATMLIAATTRSEVPLTPSTALLLYAMAMMLSRRPGSKRRATIPLLCAPRRVFAHRPEHRHLGRSATGRTCAAHRSLLAPARPRRPSMWTSEHIGGTVDPHSV